MIPSDSKPPAPMPKPITGSGQTGGREHPRVAGKTDECGRGPPSSNPVKGQTQDQAARSSSSRRPATINGAHQHSMPAPIMGKEACAPI